jgi:hypothetical protein
VRQNNQDQFQNPFFAGKLVILCAKITEGRPFAAKTLLKCGFWPSVNYAGSVAGTHANSWLMRGGSECGIVP